MTGKEPGQDQHSEYIVLTKKTWKAVQWSCKKEVIFIKFTVSAI